MTATPSPEPTKYAAPWWVWPGTMLALAVATLAASWLMVPMADEFCYVLGETLTPQKAAGLAMCIAGPVLYVGREARPRGP